MSSLPITSIETTGKPAAVTPGAAFLYWLKLGFISFGGPAGQIAMMHQELVEKRRWISEQRFLHALNFCMVLPGPEAMQLATYIGWLMHRRVGGLVAGLLFVLPSLVMLIALSWAYMAWGHVPAVEGLLWGIKPAVVAIVLFAAWRIGKRTLRTRSLMAVAGGAFAASASGILPFPAVVALAALAGVLIGRYAPAAVRTNGHGGAATQALIDDDTVSPEHAGVTRRRTLGMALSGVLLVCALIALLTLALGWDATLTQMAFFFSKAALLTFGGAYAVLPYVYQGAVEHAHWLTATQMLDGLALGETTPGPLIMVVAFVGFVGGWTHAAGAHVALAGIAGACVATVFTFLPSFIFIFAGAPLIEATRGNLRLDAPLSAISAAVVGVIANLGVFFAMHVFLPGAGTVDWPALALFIMAAVALMRLNIGMIPVIAACGLTGLGVFLIP